MGYNKLKAEKYSNVGGINQKASTYVTGDNEFLDIENYDFQVPGALNKRWGFTASYLSSASFSIGSSQTINAIWQVTTPFTFPDNIPNGIRTLNLYGYDSGVAANETLGSTLVPWVTSVTTTPTAQVWDHSEFQEATYYSNSLTGYKNTAQDAQAFLFGMLTPPTLNPGSLSGLTVVSTAAGTTLTGTYVYQYAYLDNLGFVGAPSATFIYSTAGLASINISGFTTSVTGQTALAYGATAYVVFRNRVPGFPTTDLVSIGTLPIGSSLFNDQGDQSNINGYFFYQPGGFDFASETTQRWNISEVFTNRLWIDAGLNSIAFSELEDLQNFDPANTRIIAANNFRLTAFKAYNQSLMILCQKGVFRLTGDTPDNFSVVEMSGEYGGISDKAVVVFNERMWFLDYEAIIEFNGSNFNNIGNRVDGYLGRMNKERAYRRACAMHLPDRNEVWFSIPIDGSNINNVTLVYDYLVDGWTTFKGDKFKASALGILFNTPVDQSNYAPTVKNYYFGSIGASMYRFGASFTSDDGTGMTLTYTTKFHNELGKSQTAQFRRFYQDIGSYTGATLNFGLEMFANYSNSAISYTVSFGQNIWQNRIDFGIPAKSLSIKCAHGSTTGNFQINGYTVEFRFQRAV